MVDSFSFYTTVHKGIKKQAIVSYDKQIKNAYSYLEKKRKKGDVK